MKSHADLTFGTMTLHDNKMFITEFDLKVTVYDWSSEGHWRVTSFSHHSHLCHCLPEAGNIVTLPMKSVSLVVAYSSMLFPKLFHSLALPGAPSIAYHLSVDWHHSKQCVYCSWLSPHVIGLSFYTKDLYLVITQKVMPENHRFSHENQQFSLKSGGFHEKRQFSLKSGGFHAKWWFSLGNLINQLIQDKSFSFIVCWGGRLCLMIP